jgi:hypothetical protein
MQITMEFLEAEIADLQTEMRKAETFLISAQSTIQAYQMLVRRLDTPETVKTAEQENNDG